MKLIHLRSHVNCDKLRALAKSYTHTHTEMTVQCTRDKSGRSECEASSCGVQNNLKNCKTLVGECGGGGVKLEMRKGINQINSSEPHTRANRGRNEKFLYKCARVTYYNASLQHNFLINLIIRNKKKK